MAPLRPNKGITTKSTESKGVQTVRSAPRTKSDIGPSEDERFELLYAEVGKIAVEGQNLLKFITEIAVEGRDTRHIVMLGFVILLVTTMGMVMNYFYHAEERTIREREWRSIVDQQNAETELVLVEARRLLEASQATSTRFKR